MKTMHAVLEAVGRQPTFASVDTTWIRVEREAFAPLVHVLVHEHNLPLSLLFGTDDRRERKGFGIHVVLSLDEAHEWLVVSTEVPESDPAYPSVTSSVMAAHWYERLLSDMFGVTPAGHPDPRRLVHHENVPLGTHPLRKDFAWDAKLSHDDVPYPMHHVAGEGVYEIPVGPIHAGIIEPGHFRFNVAGERIITLEGKLFFTHKGVEKLLEGRTPDEAMPFIERVSDDMSPSHALAFCLAVEKLCDAEVPQQARLVRTLLHELERLTMHIHDLSNMAGMGTGYSVAAAQGFRVKEDLVRLSARLLGNRFWRGVIVPGGVARTLLSEERVDVEKTVASVCAEMHALLKVFLVSDGLHERLETTGVLPLETAKAYGALGLPARASGLDRDVRRDHPYAAYLAPELLPRVVTQKAGDVYARYRMRVEELQTTEQVIQKLLPMLSADGFLRMDCQPRDGMALGAVESWRGEILTIVRIKDGKIDRCFPRDPSFCNWALFGELGPGNIVPDFPLCNKSLNLSYSGTDL
ncbi:NADH-quinone oxidoreductase subunit C [Candidatus Uhrbacteria bacterium]|nr:NADH-quinone oxidoreductase subunit C [Candidatus Uhrbacteria bacterium]